MSAVVEHNGTVYVAGQVPDDTSVGITEQTAQVLAKIDQLLAAVGSSKANLLSATIWLPDMRNFADMNKAWVAWVDPDGRPARATVGSALARADIGVEIAVVAHT